MGSVLSTSYKLIGANATEEANSPDKETETEIKEDQKESTPKAKNKSNEEPTFSTNLSIPIDKFIEETINSSLSESSKDSIKQKTKSKRKKKEKLKKPGEFAEYNTINKQPSLKVGIDISKKNNKLLENLDDDDGFPFQPVEKSKKSKLQLNTEKNKEEANTSISIPNKSKSNSVLSKNYKINKSHKQAVVEPLPVVTRRFSDSFEKVQNFVIVNRLDEKSSSESETIIRESKKVTTSVSYASVVSSSYDNCDIFHIELNNSETESSHHLEAQKVSLNTNQSKPNSKVENNCIILNNTSNLLESINNSNSSAEDNSPRDLTDSNTSSSIEILESSVGLKESFPEFGTPSELNFADNFNKSVKNSSLREEATYSPSPNSFKSSSSLKIVDSSSNAKYIHSEQLDANKYSDNSNRSSKLEENFSVSSSIYVIDYQEDIDNLLDDNLSGNIPNLIEPSGSTGNLAELEFERKVLKNIPKNLKFSNTVLIQKSINLIEAANSDSTKYSEIKKFDENINPSESIVDKFSTANNLKTLQDNQELQEYYLNQSDILPNNQLPETKRKEIEVNSCDPESRKLKLEKMSQVRVLTLNDKEHQECTLYRLWKNWTIQFRIGPSLFGRSVFLYCNYPVNDNSFSRSKYYFIPWQLDEGCKNSDDTAAFANITVKISGSFHYFFTFSESDISTIEGSGYFLVDPIIKYGNNEELKLDCIQCQTVLAKSLGSFSNWENKLKVAKESGYNMIHFTPIQELGDSNSSYSLREQLNLNPVFKKDNSEMPTFEEIETFISNIRKEWKMSSVCDIVLNHTANESTWIKEHPEATYNCINCAYMRPAYLLDAALYQFSIDVKKGLYEDKGIPTEVNTEEHLKAIRYHFRQSVLEPLNIPELFMCDVNKIIMEFLALARTSTPTTFNSSSEKGELKLEQDPEFKRISAKINMKLALELFNIYRNDTFDEESRLRKCSEDLKTKLEALNKVITDEIENHLNTAIENVISGIRYYRVQADGPKFKEITIKTPLVYRYFTDYGKPNSLKEHEEIMYSENGRFLMAHNGWVMNSDPLKNFASPDSRVYLRRELIAWGDSVKLRYGDKPEDSPFLWNHMKKYVEQTVKIFDGVRLDNCHSTPIPVAEYLLDCARKIRPDLYVVAELFTNSDMTDNIFVNRLGITSLIREAMSAWDSHEEGRLVYRYGGYPVGSFYQPSIRPLIPSVAHALFLDLTHDNPSPVEKRSIFDLLPSTALVNMACCASGSNRGYDELVPHHIHVVDETREYTEWTDNEKLAIDNVKYVSKSTRLINAKKAINNLHFTLGKEGYDQVYVDQMDSDIVAVTRHCPNTHQSYILVAFTAFSHPGEDAGNYQRAIKPLRFEGVLDEIVLEAALNHTGIKNGCSMYKKFENFVKDTKYINGVSEYEVSMKQHIQINESDIFEKVNSGSQNITQLNFKNFKPGSIVVVKTSLPVDMNKAVSSVRNLINEFSKTKSSELYQIINNMSLADLNRALYRCDKEERDEGYGFDTYNIPNFGFMVYAGLQGMVSLLANIRPNNDLGHPMCANLRDGDWMIDYIWRRMKFDDGTKALGKWIEDKSNSLKAIPRYLIPCYFDVIVTGIYMQLIERCYELMSGFVKNGSTFVRGLSLGSVQMAAYIKTADLPTLSSNLTPPKPGTRKNDKGEEIQACVTLSAGLPHFSIGYMRNWGRDTFIALRGLFILTGRYQEAREHILAYGACLRHGLIPNLLDGGRNPRFNCRDAVWWWLHCIKEYVEETPNGLDILSDIVSRIFPKDDSPNQPPGTVEQPLHDVMQEALNVHFQGLAFRERNAGRQIDEHMSDQGFNNQIGIHPETGFVFGGNQWNCGTWMDKMGSSDKAGNRGKPATPRDGSAIELIGLSKAVITWLDKLYNHRKYPYSGVQRTHKNGSVTKWSFKEWSDKIQTSFEKYFWVNTTSVNGEIRSDLINKRGIYKDTYGSSQDFPDFQLRCNFPIAMVVAPELFTPEHAWHALSQAEKYLLGPLGMKTLDPQDWAYRGDYDNSNNSEDPSVANGFNYHQGPEWVWPIGFFLRAKLLFAQQNDALKETLANTKLILSKHFVELQTSVWRGLPELTNSNGTYCKDSSRTQAWSMSCVLEVLYDLQKIESSQVTVVN